MIEKAVINNKNRLNGTTFDCFEYFYRMWELDKSVKLISKYPIFDKDFLNKKYIVEQECFNNIIIDDPLEYRYINCLLLDVTSFKNCYINAENAYILRNENIYINTKNPIYFDEYTFYKNYILKIYYQIQRKFDHQDATYFNIMDFNNIEVYKLLKKYKNPIIKEENNLKNPEELKNFKPDIYKYFDTYVYIKTNKTYDRHPRMFLECSYQGIKCEYYNLSNLKDPSWYRFLDRNDLEKRNILNDEMISRFLNF